MTLSSIGLSLSRPPAGLRVAGLASVLISGLLSGCAPADKFAPACPQLGFLPDAADVTRFGPTGGRDVTDMVLDGSIKAIPAQCQNADVPGKVQATVQVVFDLTRGPAAKTRTAEVPYVVGVIRNDKIIDAQDYLIPVQFPGNIEKITVTGPNIQLLFPVTKDVSAAAYRIVVGFKLTPEQLAYNRRRGPR